MLPKQEKKYFSFLFSDSSIKIAKIEEKKGKKILQIFFESPLPAGLIVDSEVKDSEKLAAVINDLKLKAKVTENSVVVGLAETKASIHTLSLPKLTPEEINQAIKFQADSFLPFPYQNEYLDWMFLGEPSNGKVKILISAIPKNIIDGYVAAFGKTGLNPLTFESTSLSLLRLVAPVERKGCLIAEISDALTILVINSEGEVETSSTIADKAQFLPTLKKILDYYYREQKEPPRIYLCGKGASNEFFAQTKQLKMQPLPIKTDVEGIPAGKEPELAMLVSLAQKIVALPEDAQTINVLPPTVATEYQVVSQQAKEKKLNIILFVFLIFINLIVFIIYLQAKINTAKLLASQSGKEIFGHLQGLEEYREKSKLINLTSQQSSLLQKVLAEIANPSQKNVRLVGLAFSDEKKEITLLGRALSKDDLLQYKENLEKMSLFSKVSIPLPSLKEETNLDFRIILKL